MCGKLFLDFLLLYFSFPCCQLKTSGLMYSSDSENRKPHTSHMPSPSDVGATIFRMTVVLIAHRHPLSSSPTRRECGRSPGKSQDRCLPRRRSLSSFIAVVVGCRRRWLSTTSHFIVVVPSLSVVVVVVPDVTVIVVALVGRRRPLSP